jgi:predicted nucleotidyltransferase
MDAATNRFEKYKQTTLDIILSKLPSCKVILFGSRARKTNQPGADIDLALDNGTPIPIQKLGEIAEIIENSNMPLMVDLVDLYTATETLKKEVIREGIVWKA